MSVSIEKYHKFKVSQLQSSNTRYYSIIVQDVLNTMRYKVTADLRDAKTDLNETTISTQLILQS